MKISLHWLKRYVPLETAPEELATVLPMLGFEVESITYQGLPKLNNVVVGELLAVDKHPNADRLTVCQVKVSDNEAPCTIVCGAKNHKVGDRVPVALPGAVLPGNFEIKVSKLRGVESFGMLCAKGELGFATDEPGILILEERPQIGTPINEVFPDSDVIFDLAITPNRGDCFGHIGIARELAAYYGTKLSVPITETKAQTQSFDSGANPWLMSLTIDQVAKNDCPYYTAWVVRDVHVGPSPAWLKRDLEAVGLRSINNVVDITNWVMLETGQPLHAFDADHIEGNALTIRLAQAGDVITTLDGRKREWNAEAQKPLLIADSMGPLAIAGIMGGDRAEVRTETRTIVLESAYFNAASIRKSARALGLMTDSSHRFERDVDPEGVVRAACRAVDLIVELAGGKLAGVPVHLGMLPRSARVVELDPEFIREVLGFGPSNETIASYLKRAGFLITEADECSNETLWKVTIPTFRSDVHRPEDLVEEVLRLYGTEKIPQAAVHAESCFGADDPRYCFTEAVSAYLAAQRAQECWNYSMRQQPEVAVLTSGRSQEAVEVLGLLNPLSAEETHLRPSLIPGLLDTLRLNFDRQNDVRRLFEVGRVFRMDDDKSVNELYAVSMIVVSEPQERLWQAPSKTDFYELKEHVEMVARLAGIEPSSIGWKRESSACTLFYGPDYAAVTGCWNTDGYTLRVGLVTTECLKAAGLKANTVWAFECVFALDHLMKMRASRLMRAFSLYPAAKRDIAIIVPDATLCGDVQQWLGAHAQATLGDGFGIESMHVFDRYQGAGLPEGCRSFAFTLCYRSSARTLTDGEVGTAFESMLQRIRDEKRFEVRTSV